MSSPNAASPSPKLEDPDNSMDQPSLSSLPLAVNEIAIEKVSTQVNYCQPNTTADFNELAQEGSRILAILDTTLKSLQTDTVNVWLRDVDRVKKQMAEHTNPIIAIVGTTGAGKSSLINSLLGQMQLLPTNCVRACTSAPTEISWNDQPDGLPHQAEVEFISREDWEKELRSLFGDLFDTDGKMDKDVMTSQSEAEVAFHKIRAVYPGRATMTLAQADIEELMQTPEVSGVLGTRIRIAESTPENLQVRIKRYVDSKDKRSVKPKSRNVSETNADDFEYWPLIRRISIRTKAPILGSGCTIVDLPGIGDSNEARSSVAASYFQKCTALWIVSPINRAVDDGHARSLLGEAFKRQMFRDGTLDRITFVCSKIDDIDVKEAKNNFSSNLAFMEKIDAINVQKTEHSREIAELERSISDCEQEIRCLKMSLEKNKIISIAYHGSREQIESGQTKYPLIFVESSKRGGSTEEMESTNRKRAKLEGGVRPVTTHSEPAQFPTQSIQTRSTSAATSNMNFKLQEDLTRSPLTTSDVENKLKRIKDQTAKIRANMKTLYENLASRRHALKKLKETRIQDCWHEWLECVQRRNLWATERLNIDFITGIQDMNRIESQRDDRNYDPSIEEENDYKYILPVFCVSSKSFRSLANKRNKGRNSVRAATGFMDVVDTGIPGLIDHAIQMGSRQLQQTAKNYIDGINRLLTALSTWSTGGPSDTPEESRILVEESLDIDQMILAFCEKLQHGFHSVSEIITEHLLPQVTEQLLKASETASDNLEGAYKGWETMLYQTYKAIVRRDGRYVKRARTVDFHEDLLQTFNKKVDPTWNKVFNIKIPKSMHDFSKSATDMIEDFKKQFSAKLASRGMLDTNINAFEEQAQRLVHLVQAEVQTYKVNLQVGQREANRLFLPTIKKHMLPIYPVVTAESGRGCYNRIKTKMQQHVSNNQKTMFKNVVKRSSGHLEFVRGDIQEKMTEEVLRLLTAFRKDCILFTGFAVQSTAENFSDLDLDAQTAILKALNKAGISFGVVTGDDRVAVSNDTPAAVDTDADGSIFSNGNLSESARSSIFDSDMDELSDDYDDL